MHAQQKIYTSIIIVLILYILHLDHESAYNGIMETIWKVKVKIL